MQFPVAVRAHQDAFVYLGLDLGEPLAKLRHPQVFLCGVRVVELQGIQALGIATHLTPSSLVVHGLLLYLPTAAPLVFRPTGVAPRMPLTTPAVGELRTGLVKMAANTLGTVGVKLARRNRRQQPHMLFPMAV